MSTGEIPIIKLKIDMIRNLFKVSRVFFVHRLLNIYLFLVCCCVVLFCVVLLEIEIRKFHPHPAFPPTNSVESEPKEMSDAMDG